MTETDEVAQAIFISLSVQERLAACDETKARAFAGERMADESQTMIEAVATALAGCARHAARKADIERAARAMVRATRPELDPDQLSPLPRGQVGAVPLWQKYRHMAAAAVDCLQASLSQGLNADEAEPLPHTEEALREAIAQVLGRRVYEALRANRTSLTTLHDMAIVSAFTDGAPDRTCAILRQAKSRIDRDGAYLFDAPRRDETGD